MKHWKLLGGTAFLAIIAGNAALADVSNSDVWNAWKSMGESMGQTITVGSETETDGTLTLSDVRMEMSSTDVTATATLSEIVMTEEADGTVTIETPETYEVELLADPEGGESVRAVFTVTSEGLEMVASGTPDAVSYAFEAIGMDLDVTELVVDGEPLEMDGVVEMTDLSGTYETTGSKRPRVTSQMDVALTVVTLHMDEPGGGGGTFDASMDVADLSLSSDGTLMLARGVKELPAMLAEGADSHVNISQGRSSYMVDFQDSEGSFKFDGSAGAGELDVAISPEALSYLVSNSDVSILASGSEIPLPEVAADLGLILLDLKMPVAQSEEPQDFGFAVRLEDLSVSDMIWGMIDQGGSLPRDPATLILDLTGKANWLVDILNPDSDEIDSVEMPAELHALTLNELRLAVAGAELTGDGSFTFDMDNLETFEGIPAPTGALNLMLTGGNALLDKLVDMGLVPQDQAMGARMMMGLFARPGEQEDSLVSVIEVDGASGAVSANGQRLQ
jgi:hypothetical protein